MFEKWYKIEGLTNELAYVWKDELRQDVIVWEENGNIEARIRLGIIEANVMKYYMRQNNKQQPYYRLQLVPA